MDLSNFVPSSPLTHPHHITATMATKDQFSKTVTVFEDSGSVECNKQTTAMPRTKLKCQYDGISLTFTMRFGKGTDDPKEPVQVILDTDTGGLGNLSFQRGTMYQKPIVHATWECRNTPLITNYTSSRADRNKLEHQFAQILLKEGVKNFRIRVPNIQSFSWDDWSVIITTHEKCVERRRAMLARYPSPWNASNSLPPISEAPPHIALNTFPDTDSWGTVMYAALEREISVTLSKQQDEKLKSCWGIFEKVDASIFCHVYSHPVGSNQPTVAVPTLGEKVKISLREDGCRQLSSGGKDNSRDAVVIDLGKNADFVLCLHNPDDSDLYIMKNSQWTEKDMNFGRISTIAIKRKDNLVSIRRHRAGVVLACTKVKTPLAFPLESLLHLNRELPRIPRDILTASRQSRLIKMLKLLNPTQQEAFERSHRTGKPALVIQGPPGTGKTHLLAILALSYSLVREMKCLICTPSNVGGNAITEEVMAISAKEKTSFPWLEDLRIVRWLTPTAEHCILTTGRAAGITESMARMSMASHIRAYAQSLADKYYDDEWLRLCKQIGSLSQKEFERFKVLTAEYERHCLSMMHIVVSTCDNSTTLNTEYFRPNIIILDESSQAIEAAALLPVVQFLGSLEQIVFAGDDQQLQPFVLSTPSENEFSEQLRKSWFERARLSAVVPCVTLGQQYRMRPEISRLIIKHFYPNKLQNDESTMVDRPAYNNYMRVAENLNLSGVYWAASEWPISNIIMVDMEDGVRTFSQSDSAGSKFNHGHIAVVRDICLALLGPETDIYGQDITVMTPYAAQRVRHLRALEDAGRLNSEMGRVTVSTVDRLQGGEANIVLLDLVIRNKRTDGLGFMRDRHRLNVAISRARDVLIVIGDGRKYQRLLSKRRVTKAHRQFLEIMFDIGTNTVLWGGNKSSLAEFGEWDMEEGEWEEESDEAGEKDGPGHAPGYGPVQGGPVQGGDEAVQNIRYRY